MKILHRYIARLLWRNLAICLSGFTILFLIVDFFERVDTFISEDVPFLVTLKYFLLKIPLTVSLMLPIAMLVATMFTFGILAKNSEITAMRSAGMRVLWLARPLVISGLFLSIACLLINETIVPYTTRRLKEVFNIDIRQKDKRGAFSQSDFWWRNARSFYSVGIFDSRTNSLLALTRLDLDSDFRINKRTEAEQVKFVDPVLGWSMENVVEYRFPDFDRVNTKNTSLLTLPISETPEDFYDVKADPDTMSYRALKKFIKKQKGNGVATQGYLADLYEKLSFPFIILIIPFVVLPFALKPARTGTLAASFIAALVIGFSYYAVHSFSIAMGRAELWPAFLAAWVANFLMGFVGLVLNLGAESP